MRDFVFLYSVIILAHLPISVFTGIDESCILLYFIDIVVFSYLYSTDNLFRLIVNDRVSLLWLVLILFHTINSFAHNVPYEGGYFMMLMRMFDVYLLMVLCAYCFIVDKNKYVNYMLYGFSLFLILTLSVTEIGKGQRLDGSINATQIGQTAGCAMLMVVFAKYLNNISYFKLLAFSILPILVTLLAGSRNGLLLIALAFFVLVFANMVLGMSLEKIIIFCIGCVFLYYASDYVLNNTFVGERMLNTNKQAEMYGLETGTILDVFGDRGVYYYYGWKLFLEQPIFGIGLWNFRYISPLPFPLHSEYMVHLCEGGLIGIIVYFLIIKEFVSNVIKEFVNNKTEISFILLFFVFSYLSVGLSARLFFTPHFYTLLGPVLAFRIIRKCEVEYI